MKTHLGLGQTRVSCSTNRDENEDVHILKEDLHFVAHLIRTSTSDTSVGTYCLVDFIRTIQPFVWAYGTSG